MPSDDLKPGADWHTTASYAVIFAQRQVDGGWERRIEAEQTEVEPASEPRQWPGWDCARLCEWMLGQLGLPEGKADSEGAAADQAGAASAAAPAASAAEPASGAAPARAARTELRIDSATITDARHELDVIREGSVIAAPPEDLTPPVRLSLTVRGGRSGQQLRAAVWFRRPAGPGWSPHEPVIVPSSGRAEFTLSSVPPGAHDVKLLAWATDASAILATVTLPKLVFRQEEEPGGDPVVAGP